MSRVDTYRRAADFGRKVAAQHVRLVRVSIVRETWDAPVDTIDAAVVLTSATLLSPSPKVVANTEGPATAFGGGPEAASTGVLRAAQYIVGPITRTFPGGGYTQAQLLLAPASVSETVYLLLDDGGDQFTVGGEKFDVIAADASRPLRITLIVQRSAQ